MANGFVTEFDPGVVAPRGAGATVSGSTLVVTWRGRPRFRVAVPTAGVSGGFLGNWATHHWSLGWLDLPATAGLALLFAWLAHRLVLSLGGGEVRLTIDPSTVTLCVPGRSARSVHRSTVSGLAVGEVRTTTEDGEVVEYWLSAALRQGGLERLTRIEYEFATWITRCYAAWDERSEGRAAPGVHDALLAPAQTDPGAPPGAVALKEDGALVLRWPGLSRGTVDSLTLSRRTLRFEGGGLLGSSHELELDEVRDLLVIEEEASSFFSEGPRELQHKLVVVRTSGGRRVLGPIAPQYGQWVEARFAQTRAPKQAPSL